MLVIRRIIHAKPGKTGEVSDLAKAERERLKRPHSIRIYAGRLTHPNEVIIEGEWESVAEYETYAAEWYSSTEFAEYVKKMEGLSVGSSPTEIRRLVE